jgi:hypothetical protein
VESGPESKPFPYIQISESFFIDTIDPIVHISVLNDNLPSKRLIILQRFGGHRTAQGFIQCEVSSVGTFESKS